MGNSHAMSKGELGARCDEGSPVMNTRGGKKSRHNFKTDLRLFPFRCNVTKKKEKP